MRFSTFKLFILDAFKSLRRNITLSFASIATVMATLLILGAFLMTLLNVKLAINDVESKIVVKVILNDDIKIDDQKNVYDKISKTDGVSGIEFESKQQALVKLKQQLGDKNKSLVEGMENDNPLPNSYLVSVKSPDVVQKVVDNLKNVNGIEQVKDGKDIVNKITSITKTIKWVGTGLFVILISVSLFLIGNTIKLAVYSRRREIGIMKYIGATDWFIRWPFIIEGVVIGLIGAVFSVTALYFLYNLVYTKAASSMMFVGSFVSPMYVLTTISWEFMLGGLFIGALGSIIVIRKFLVV